MEYFVNTVFNYPTLAECYTAAAFNGLNKLSNSGGRCGDWRARARRLPVGSGRQARDRSIRRYPEGESRAE